MPENTYRARICNICINADYRQIHYIREWNLSRDPVYDVSVVPCEIADEYEQAYHTPCIERGQAIHPHQLSHFFDLILPRIVLGASRGPWCHDSHLWNFTTFQMCNMLRKGGFSIFSFRTLHGYTPDSRLKRRTLDLAASLESGDECNIIAARI